MKLDDTKRLLAQDVATANPMDLLANALEAAIELLSLDGNDFAWSSWENADEAIKEVRSILMKVQSGALPERLEVAVLFAPTGPLQEVSISSGWAEAFLNVSERYDHAEKKLWR